MAPLVPPKKSATRTRRATVLIAIERAEDLAARSWRSTERPSTPTAAPVLPCEPAERRAPDAGVANAAFLRPLVKGHPFIVSRPPLLIEIPSSTLQQR